MDYKLWSSSISDSNQEKIVDEGGLDALLMLLQSSRNMTILRVASGAIANLAMNGKPDDLVQCNAFFGLAKSNDVFANIKISVT